eukprot:1511564-Rhodomonas_salina.1
MCIRDRGWLDQVGSPLSDVLLLCGVWYWRSVCCYAVCGTGVAYAAMRCGTGTRNAAVLCGVWLWRSVCSYAVCGTGVAYAAMRCVALLQGVLLRGVWLWHTVCCYALCAPQRPNSKTEHADGPDRAASGLGQEPPGPRRC